MTKPTDTPAISEHTAKGTVATELAPRYAKQLATHFRHKAEVSMEAEGPRITLTGGSCVLVVRDKSLELRASAETAEALDRVKKVIGSHLERFGTRDRLTVVWSDRD